jgi:deazaflavin-dependent oxidoreductase (nitroreductase family)
MNQAHAVRVPSIVPVLNPLVRRLLGAGLPFGPNVNLTVRGRASGRLHTFPVAIIRLGERRFVQSPFGEVQWVRNLRAHGEAAVAKGRGREVVRAVELAPEAGGPILQAALAPYLRSRLMARVATRFFDVRRDSPPEAFVEEARRHPMFELLPRAAD